MSGLKMLSWNVNGIRATYKKGFMEWFNAQDADIVFLQETKAAPEQIPEELQNLEGYHCYFESSQKRKGYSGVALFSKEEPLRVGTGFGIEEYDTEGRIICAEYEDFVIYGIYFPNGQSSDERLAYKMGFYQALLEDIQNYMSEGIPVIITGDVNTAHKPIDVAKPDAWQHYSGFLDEERAWIDELIDLGFVDTLREINQEEEQYSFWEQRVRARDRNEGWRIDYFFVSEDIAEGLTDAFIQMDQMGSDHAPVGIEIDI